MRKKKADEGGGGPNWLDTYADMVTLVLTFFVLMFSISSVDAEKWKMIVQAFSADGNSNQQLVIPGDSGSNPGDGNVDPSGSGDSPIGNTSDSTIDEVVTFDDLYPYLKQYVESNGLENDVELVKGDGYTFITFRNSIFFNGNSSVLREEGKVILRYICSAFINITDDISQVVVEGHTARAENGDDPGQRLFDWDLSSARAGAVCGFIDIQNSAANKVIDRSKLKSHGNGDTMPIAPHDNTEENRIKNRRVEIYISKEGSSTLTLEEIYKQINGTDVDASDISTTDIPGVSDPQS